MRNESKFIYVRSLMLTTARDRTRAAASKAKDEAAPEEEDGAKRTRRCSLNRRELRRPSHQIQMAS